MTAAPHSFEVASAPLGTDRMAMKWAALGEAASVVATLASREQQRADDDLLQCIRRADAWRQARVEQGIGDLAAIMEPGLAALLAVSARGADPRPAAAALLDEFNTARDALLALLPPAGY